MPFALFLLDASLNYDYKIKIKRSSISGSKTQAHDIALIRLNEPVPLYDEDPTKSFTTPICLPWRENDLDRTFKKATIAGWGNIKTSIKNIEMKRNSPYITSKKVTIANDVCKD